MHNNIITKNELRNMRNRRNEGLELINNITKKRLNAFKNGKKFLDRNSVREDLYADMFTKGVIPFPNSSILNYGILSPMTFYRGESKNWPESKSTMARRLNSDLNEEEVHIYVFISNLRINSFRKVLSRLNRVKKWSIGRINPKIIAQHYGLRTSCLDLTDDIEVALFFACSKLWVIIYMSLLKKKI